MSATFEIRHALVTGAGSGIGRAIALRLATPGSHVHILELRADAGEETAQLIRENGGTASVIAADVADTATMSQAFAALPRLDILINNAGIAHIGNVLGTTPEDLDRLYQVNVRGVYHCLHFGVRKMLANGGGSIVNLASIAAKVGIPDRITLFGAGLRRAYCEALR